MKNLKFYQVVSGLLFVWIAGNMVFRYAVGASFWLDEAFVVHNLEGINLSGIFDPFPPETCQTFPRFYLGLIKLSGMLFGYGPYAMRFLPFLLALGGLVLWFDVIRRYATDTPRKIFWLICFCSSFMLIQYSAEVKQYSGDLFWSGLLVNFYIRKLNNPAGNTPFWVYMLLGLPILFSYPYLALVCGVIFLELLPSGEKVLNGKPLAALAVSSVLSFFLLYWLDISRACADLEGYWSGHFVNLSGMKSFLYSSGARWYDFATGWFYRSDMMAPIYPPGVTGILELLTIPFVLIGGFFFIARSGGMEKSRRFLWLLGLTVSLELYAGAILHRYPFGALRVTFFAFPFVAFFVSEGIGFLFDKRWTRFAAVILVFPLANIFVSFPGSPIIQNLNTIDWESPVVNRLPLLVSDCSYYQVKTYWNIPESMKVFQRADRNLESILKEVEPPFIYLVTHNCGKAQTGTVERLMKNYRVKVFNTGNVVGYLYVHGRR